MKPGRPNACSNCKSPDWDQPRRILDFSLTEPWRLSAACRNRDTSIFFPDDDRVRSIAQIRAAKAICSTCPVQDACYDYADKNDIYDGIWGGYAMTRPARKKRAERARAS